MKISQSHQYGHRLLIVQLLWCNHMDYNVSAPSVFELCGAHDMKKYSHSTTRDRTGQVMEGIIFHNK